MRFLHSFQYHASNSIVLIQRCQPIDFLFLSFCAVICLTFIILFKLAVFWLFFLLEIVSMLSPHVCHCHYTAVVLSLFRPIRTYVRLAKGVNLDIVLKACDMNIEQRYLKRDQNIETKLSHNCFASIFSMWVCAWWCVGCILNCCPFHIVVMSLSHAHIPFPFLTDTQTAHSHTFCTHSMRLLIPIAVLSLFQFLFAFPNQNYWVEWNP